MMTELHGNRQGELIFWAASGDEKRKRRISEAGVQDESHILDHQISLKLLNMKRT